MLSTAKILSAEELIDFGFCAPEIVKGLVQIIIPLLIFNL